MKKKKKIPSPNSTSTNFAHNYYEFLLNLAHFDFFEMWCCLHGNVIVPMIAKIVPNKYIADTYNVLKNLMILSLSISK